MTLACEYLLLNDKCWRTEYYPSSYFEISIGMDGAQEDDTGRKEFLYDLTKISNYLNDNIRLISIGKW